VGPGGGHGFARLAGQVIGVIANSPMFKGGALFIDSADKVARFIQVCDAFGIPLDQPGEAERVPRPSGYAASTSGTSTPCGSLPNWSWMTSWNRKICAGNWNAGSSPSAAGTGSRPGAATA